MQLQLILTVFLLKILCSTCSLVNSASSSLRKQHHSIRKPSTTAVTSTSSHFLQASPSKLQTLREEIGRGSSFGTTPHLARTSPLTSGIPSLSCLTRNFTKEHVLHKIFNRNTVKISYSCMPNLKQNIDGHNKSILHKKIVPPTSCNCRVKTECPMSGNCLKELVVYQATVSTEDHHPPRPTWD